MGVMEKRRVAWFFSLENASLFHRKAQPKKGFIFKKKFFCEVRERYEERFSWFKSSTGWGSNFRVGLLRALSGRNIGERKSK
jgi:hypothetical protein